MALLATGRVRRSSILGLVSGMVTAYYGHMLNSRDQTMANLMQNLGSRPLPEEDLYQSAMKRIEDHRSKVGQFSELKESDIHEKMKSYFFVVLFRCRCVRPH